MSNDEIGQQSATLDDLPPANSSQTTDPGPDDGEIEDMCRVLELGQEEGATNKQEESS